jgi:pimeloyl-ACP methyl ester carboxylesterase
MGLLARVARGALTPRSLTREQTLTAAERLSAATHLVASLELLSRYRDRRPGGVNDWSVSRQNIKHRGPMAHRFFDVVSRPGVTTALHVARAASAAFLLAPTGRMRKSRLAANAIISGSSIALFPGQIYGTDGSDQASFLVQSAATVARASRDPRVADGALWFLALQSTLNYAASGWVKMVSPTWRSGRAMSGVMRTATYGHEPAWRVTQRYPRTARTLGHAVLGMECLFPAVFAARGRLAPVFVGSAAAFHLANARLMGLGRFVGAFCAMHPAVLYASDPGRRTAARPGVRRTDTMPVVVGALAAAGLGVGIAAQVRRRRSIGRGRPQQRRLVTTAGNTLTYLYDSPEAGGPLVVFESALAATDLHWEWLRRSMSRRFSTVVYQRAGYGSSSYRGTGRFTLDAATADLADLIDLVAMKRPVVIVGHSLGGYLALRAAEQLLDRVVGVVLIDSSHPGELHRSSRQAAGAAMLDTSLRIMAPSMWLGLGALLQPPHWVDRLPEDARHGAIDQYRDSRLWSAAAREWNATRREFAAFEGQLPKVGARLLVLTAEATAEDDPVQLDLHVELGEAGDAATYQVIEGADHDTIVTQREHADRVDGHIDAFIRTIDGLVP